MMAPAFAGPVSDHQAQVFGHKDKTFYNRTDHHILEDLPREANARAKSFLLVLTKPAEAPFYPATNRPIAKSKLACSFSASLMGVV